MARRGNFYPSTCLGVPLNVPVLFIIDIFSPKKVGSNSYTQCTETFLGPREMACLWDMITPLPADGADQKALPLLGKVQNLPSHLILVAGRDLKHIAWITGIIWRYIFYFHSHIPGCTWPPL